MAMLKLLTTPVSWIRAAFFIFNSIFASILHTLILIPVYPIRLIFPQLYITLESFLHSKVGEAVIPVFTLYPKLRVYTDSLEKIEAVTPERAFLMANHQDSGDVPIMMCLAAKFEVTRTCTWILDRMFRWTQFGVPSQWHNDCFTVEGDKAAVVKHIRNHFSTTFFDRGHKWLIFFPEGGYLKNRGATARRWAERNNLPLLTHCCLPRTAAFVNVVQAFRGEVAPIPQPVEEVVDITIAYKGPRDLCISDIAFGTLSDTEVYLNFRSYKMSDLPKEEADLETWLYTRYQEKDEMLARFKETGSFTADGNTEFTQLSLPPEKMLYSLLFWYISAFFVIDFYKCSLRNLWGLTDYLF